MTLFGSRMVADTVVVMSCWGGMGLTNVTTVFKKHKCRECSTDRKGRETGKVHR